MSDTQATLEAAEKALDVVEAKLDVLIPETVEAIKIVKNNPYLLAGAALLGLAAGGTAGYLVAKKQLEPKYLAIAEREIAEAKEFYTRLHKKDEFETPADAVAKLIPEKERAAVVAMTDYQGKAKKNEAKVEIRDITVTTEGPGERVEVTSNIFVNNQPLDRDAWDYEEELANRSEDRPYVIHHDEYMENDQEFIQTNLTYYEGDDILTDESDDPIEDVDAVVGEVNLQRFGHGSKQTNIVYVRNNLRGIDYEIIRSKGKYSEEVGGFIEHSDNHNKHRKFRGDDD